MSVKDRIKEFARYKRISIREFERRCNLVYGYVANMRVSMHPEKAANLAASFPDLNISWLFTGEGEMIKTEASFTEPLVDNLDVLKAEISFLKQELERARETIKEIKEINKESQKEILRLNRELGGLEGELRVRNSSEKISDKKTKINQSQGFTSAQSADISHGY